MVGTGVFVSMGLAAGIAGPAVIIAVILAGLVAACSALAAAQLATAMPANGGAYDYGYRFLNPYFGFIAGWMYLWAKSAAAATAALGLAGYVLSLLDLNSPLWRMGLALTAVVLITVTVLAGARPAPFTAGLLVGLGLAALIFFIWGGLEQAVAQMGENFTPFFPPPSAGIPPARALFHATALMFVAYSGYGRITMLGEDPRVPAFTVPRALLLTFAATITLYAAVAFTAVGSVGAARYAILTLDTTAPLEWIATEYGIPGATWLIAVGALAALSSVLLHLLLSLSRMLLAMGRRHDMPIAVARIRQAGQTPETAVVVVGVLVAGLALIGDIRLLWSLGAFTALVYYAITNLAAYQLPAEQRSRPRGVAAVGLVACLFLAFWLEPAIWLSGLLLIAIGIGWRMIARKL